MTKEREGKATASPKKTSPKKTSSTKESPQKESLTDTDLDRVSGGWLIGKDDAGDHSGVKGGGEVLPRKRRPGGID